LLEPGGDVAEDRLPRLSDGGSTHMAHPVGGRACGVEDTVLCHQSQGGVEIVIGPGRPERFNHLNGLRLYV